MPYADAVTSLHSQRDNGNTRLAPLVDGATWTGSWTNCDGCAQITVAAQSTRSVTLTVQWSSDADGATVDREDSATLAADVESLQVLVPPRRYVRVSVANASGASATLRVETRCQSVSAGELLRSRVPQVKEHRRIAVADLAAEAAADWVSSQAIGAGALSDDPTGIYDLASTGTSGFECVAFWVDGNDDVVADAVNIGLRPAGQFVVGSKTRIAWLDDAGAKVPGAVMSFADDAPRATWLKVTSATAPVGATHLVVYTWEVAR